MSEMNKHKFRKHSPSFDQRFKDLSGANASILDTHELTDRKFNASKHAKITRALCLMLADEPHDRIVLDMVTNYYMSNNEGKRPFYKFNKLRAEMKKYITKTRPKEMNRLLAIIPKDLSSESESESDSDSLSI